VAGAPATFLQAPTTTTMTPTAPVTTSGIALLLSPLRTEEDEDDGSDDAFTATRLLSAPKHYELCDRE